MAAMMGDAVMGWSLLFPVLKFFDIGAEKPGVRAMRASFRN